MHPPRWAERFFRWYCKEDHQEILLGDLYELFEARLETDGPRKARRQFIAGVLALFRPFTWKRVPFVNLAHRITMLSHYFKIGWRSLLRHKGFSAINIFGLALGLSCCVLMSLYVQHELSFDSFHEDSDNIYRVWSEFTTPEGAMEVAVTPNIVSPLLQRTYPDQVLAGTRIYQDAPTIRYGDKMLRAKNMLFVDSSFFDVFSFPFVEGSPSQVLREPRSIVLTRKAARRFFGSEDPMGKTLAFGSKQTPFIVNGLLEDVPENSHLDFDMLAPLHLLKWATQNEQFGSANYLTYLKLDRPDRGADLEARMSDLVMEQGGEEVASHLSFHFQPLSDVYLNSTHLEINEMARSGDRRYITLFSVLAILVLVIAVINYINLTTARAIDRAKEVGLRKVIGAQRKQIVQQFLGETVLVSLLAMGLGILMINILWRPFMELVKRDLPLSMVFAPDMLLMIMGGALLLGLIAGAYPALVLSGFRPVTVLRGKYANTQSGIWLRKGLVIFQFAVSIILIVGAITIQRQVKFIQEKKLGFDREQIIHSYISFQKDSTLSVFQTQLESDPAVLSTTTATEAPHLIQGGYNMEVGPNRDDDPMVTATMVDEKFIETLGIELLAGRPFSAAQVRKTPEEGAYAFVVNEEVLKLLGYEAQEALGKPLTLHGRKGHIQGVMANFHFAPLHQPVGPLVFFNDVYRQRLFIKLSPGPIVSQLERIRKVWEEQMPGLPFEYEFLDDSFAKLYRAEQQARQFSLTFAILAILIAVMGLLGLAAYTIVQRTKEIGIRKVLGADSLQLVGLLSREFTVLVAIAFFIGAPAAYFLMQGWLEDFAYKTPLGIDIFLLTGAVALIIAWLTVSGLAFRAANNNPVMALRQE